MIEVQKVGFCEPTVLVRVVLVVEVSDSVRVYGDLLLVGLLLFDRRVHKVDARGFVHVLGLREAVSIVELLSRFRKSVEPFFKDEASVRNEFVVLWVRQGHLLVVVEVAHDSELLSILDLHLRQSLAVSVRSELRLLDGVATRICRLDPLHFDLARAQVQLARNKIDEFPHCKGAINCKLEVLWLALARHVALHGDLLNGVVRPIDVLMGTNAGRAVHLCVAQRMRQHQHCVPNQLSLFENSDLVLRGQRSLQPLHAIVDEVSVDLFALTLEHAADAVIDLC